MTLGLPSRHFCITKHILWLTNPTFELTKHTLAYKDSTLKGYHWSMEGKEFGNQERSARRKVMIGQHICSTATAETVYIDPEF